MAAPGGRRPWHSAQSHPLAGGPQPTEDTSHPRGCLVRRWRRPRPDFGHRGHLPPRAHPGDLQALRPQRRGRSEQHPRVARALPRIARIAPSEPTCAWYPTCSHTDASQVNTPDHLESSLKKAAAMLVAEEYRLLVVDSIIAPFRFEYCGCVTAVKRPPKLYPSSN